MESLRFGTVAVKLESCVSPRPTLKQALPHTLPTLKVPLERHLNS